ncbi:MAG: hypothetical protein IBX72_05570 [Nitrospirae bacterium]|nr:hypothetical protein [Nitrospirota bacterium]
MGNKTIPKPGALREEPMLSVCMIVNGRDILFDTGASDSFSRNAVKLSIDLGKIQAAVLSHHHCYYGGGLRRLFELNSHAKVYLRKTPDGDCYFNEGTEAIITSGHTDSEESRTGGKM